MEGRRRNRRRKSVDFSEGLSATTSASDAPQETEAVMKGRVNEAEQLEKGEEVAKGSPPPVLTYFSPARRQLLDFLKKFFSEILSLSYKGPDTSWPMWLIANAAVIVVVIGCDMVMYSCASSISQKHVTGVAIFPLRMSKAAGFSFASKWERSVVIGNFIGFVLGRTFQALVFKYTPLNSRRFGYYVLQAIIQTLEVQSGAYIVRKMLCTRVKLMPVFDRVMDVAWYFLSLLLLSGIFEALVSVVEYASEIIQGAQFLIFWSTWLMADFAADLSLCPFLIGLLALLSEGQPGLRSVFRVIYNRNTVLRLLKILAVTALTVFFICMTIYSHSFSALIHPVPYLLIAVAVVAVYLSDIQQVVWAFTLACISFFCSWVTLHHSSSSLRIILEEAPEDPRLLLQIELLVSVLGFITIFVAAAIKEQMQLGLAGDHQPQQKAKDSTGAEQLVPARKGSLVKLNYHASRIHGIDAQIQKMLDLTDTITKKLHIARDPDENIISSFKSRANCILRLLDSMSDLETIKSGGKVAVQSEEFDIREVFRENEEIFQILVRDLDIVFLLKADDSLTEPALVVGDSCKLVQILVYLVTNALKFSPGGIVTVLASVFHDPGKAETETNTLSQSSSLQKRLKIRIPSRNIDTRSDKGKGIIGMIEKADPPTHTERESHIAAGDREMECPELRDLVHILFEMNEAQCERSQTVSNEPSKADTSSSQYDLELCIFEELLEAQNGRIISRLTELGKGEVFSFVAPYRKVKRVHKTLTSSEEDFEIAPASPKRFPSQRLDAFKVLNEKIKNNLKLRVLVATISSIHRRQAESQLKNLGHKVTVLKKEAQASAWGLENHGSLDLVLIDETMYNAATQIRAKEEEMYWNRMPILCMRRDGIHGFQVTRSDDDSVDGYIAKPLDVDQLLKFINEVGSD